MNLKILGLCGILAVAGACASGGSGASASGTGETASGGRRNRDLITQDDLAADASLRAQSVLEVIRALRPQFLNDRGSNTMTAQGDPEAGMVHASVDNGRVVPVSELAGMHGNEMIEIRYLNSAQAMQKFGSASRQGPVILVTTIKVK
ncbi:MAG: hypothetical protein ABI664_03030 [bacterium]